MAALATEYLLAILRGAERLVGEVDGRILTLLEQAAAWHGVQVHLQLRAVSGTDVGAPLSTQHLCYEEPCVLSCSRAKGVTLRRVQP